MSDGSPSTLRRFKAYMTGQHNFRVVSIFATMHAKYDDREIDNDFMYSRHSTLYLDFQDHFPLIISPNNQLIHFLSSSPSRRQASDEIPLITIVTLPFSSSSHSKSRKPTWKYGTCNAPSKSQRLLTELVDSNTRSSLPSWSSLIHFLP